MTAPPRPKAIRITSGLHVGGLIRRLRHDAGLTLDQLARRVHVTRNAASKRELRSPSLAVAVLVDTAHVLGYDLALIPKRHPGARPTGTGWPT